MINPLDHLGLVRSQAGRIHLINDSELFEDLYQVGFIGLKKACERFESERGLKFSTYAVPYIRGEILHYLRQQSGRTHKKPLYNASSIDNSFVDADSDYRFVDWDQCHKEELELNCEAIRKVWSMTWEKNIIERQILDLCIMQGLKNCDAAKILEVSVMTICRRKASGLERFREAYLTNVSEV